MPNLTLLIDGNPVPCYATMGAALRYKQETGHDITKMDTADLASATTYLWCCCASACKREGKPFPYTLMDFADSLTMEQLTDLFARVNAAAAEGGEEAGGADGQKKTGKA